MGSITDTWGLLTYHRVSVVSQTLRRRGRDCMVVEFTIAYSIGAYYH
jgi:hypothetical protein